LIRLTIPKRVKNIGRKIGIDSTIGLTLLTRAVQMAGGLGVVLVIAKYLSTDLQGYYYTFASILAIQVFFELGLSGVITQYAAHEYAHLVVDESYSISGDRYYQSRLSSLLHFCVKWFGIISFFLFFLLVAAGFFFFNTYNKNNHAVEWQSPWVILSLTTALNFLVDPILAFLDGVGRIKAMSKIRLWQKATNVVLLYSLLIFDFKLYSSAIASLISVILTFVLIFCSPNFKFLNLIWNAKDEWVINYYREIFPYQWRIALSWISGFFIFQLFNPVLFASSGPVVAGQMGMSLQVLNGISVLSMSWITTKVPIFASLISSKNYDELDVLFNKTLKNLIGVSGSLLTAFIAAVLVLDHMNSPFRLRLLPTVPLLCMTGTIVMNQFIFSWATYLRCHKKEPMLIQSVVSGIYCTLSTGILGHFFGLNGIVIGYTAWVFIALIWSYNIFNTNRKAWHSII
jgi:O-antigen/teichoic acid export membrane protein